MFRELTKAMGVMGTAARVSGWTMLLHHILQDQSGGDVERAARLPRLVRQWSAATPEVRSAVLLDLAWRSRQRELPRGSSPAEVHAHDLNMHARTHRGVRESFRGSPFPTMPLPGAAGALASSLGFDPAAAETSLKTVLLLIKP